MLYLNLGVSAAAAEAKQSSVTTYLVLLLVGLGSIVPAATGHRFASARATKQSSCVNKTRLTNSCFYFYRKE